MKANDYKDPELLQYVESLINNDKNVLEAQRYMKENYGVESNYDKETSTMYIYTININEGLNVVAAEQYLKNIFTPEMLNIKYGKM